MSSCRSKNAGPVLRRCAWVSALLLCLASLAVAQSQQPAQPNPPEVTRQQSAGDVNQGSRTDSAATQTALLDPAGISAIASVVSAFFAFAVWRVYKGQWMTMQVQAQHMQEGLAETKRATDAAKASADISTAMLQTNKVIERGYLDVSHTPPGFVVGPNQGGTRRFAATLRIKNLGRTPVTVTGFWFGHTVAPHTPAIDPPYPLAPPSRRGAFLVPGKKFYAPFVCDVPENMCAQLATGPNNLWLFGYVDYVDSFGKNHRVGYGRKYQHSTHANNLVFEMQPGYNYDRDLD